MKFIGRQQEQRLIHRILDRNTLDALLIFGRRRVGKSELIKKCLKDGSYIY